MRSRIFPKQFDNNYRGHWFGMWLLVPIVLLRLVIGTNSVLNTRLVATTADGIPLDSFGTAGADAVIALFALLGLYLLLFALLGVVVLIRYRAMIPFMYLLLLIQQLGSRALGMLHPIGRFGASSTQIGSALVLGILAATVIGFILSLLRAGDRALETT
jgi:hypothetical protein